MSSNIRREWRDEFGLPEPGAETFFSSKADLKAAHPESSQSHVVRRAFDLLKLDGVLCRDRAPLIYFKRVQRMDRAEIVRLHRTFWNHGGAPVLVLVAPDDVHIYSGLVRPEPHTDPSRQIRGLVQSLDRASAALREFLPSVESGEFFRRHQDSFNPAHRVDRDLLDNLQATRQKLLAVGTGKVDSDVLDALLCRLVFACYLFDRDVVGESYLKGIGLKGMSHLRDVLAITPRTQARNHLYDLFRKLGEDFNGDLFSDRLEDEARLVPASYIEPLDQFFRATDVETGQGSFWPYDFAAIPVEAISAIYERFLKGADRRQGAVYTPRILAELVLDVALAGLSTLQGRRFLDPASGSGIFLVGIFNRMAEEWKQENPDARNDRRARELRKILCTSLFGVDINPTACRITAFSLYLAYLDQLSPRDIQELQQKGHKLPRLVHYPAQASARVEGNIWCGDFFADDAQYPANADVVVGNPPWGSSAGADTAAAQWCANSQPPYSLPDNQISAAFAWKAPHHAVDHGRICFVLPHGTLFNHSGAAVDFQRTFFTRYSADHVLNLADYQRFLFEEAENPAIVLNYRRQPPDGREHQIRYWAPKTDWLITRADVISILPEDRSTVSLGDLLADLENEDAPQIWKLRYWATGRDRRLVDRLSLFPRLRDHIRQSRDGAPATKRWLVGEGFQPLGPNDDKSKKKELRLPSKTFIEATSPHIDLFVLPQDCETLRSEKVSLRRAPDAAIFRAPHVLVAQGFTSIAFADFDVSFRHALRGICGPQEDRDLLIFLAAYLRSPIARYYLFHTSSNWGISRQKVHLEELLRLPFFLPDDLPSAARRWKIVAEVSRIVTSAISRAAELLTNREELVREADRAIEPLVDEYFDVIATERVLIEDTVSITIPSVRPTRRRSEVPTIEPSREQQRQQYTQRLCDTLNSWARASRYTVHGRSMASSNLGFGLAVLHKTSEGKRSSAVEDDGELLNALSELREVTSQRLNILDLPRAAKVFDGDHLYVLKPIGQRFWTETAALNDADEIAGSILMQGSKGTP